jgi:hypothetical protein
MSKKQEEILAEAIDIINEKPFLKWNYKMQYRNKLHRLEGSVKARTMKDAITLIVDGTDEHILDLFSLKINEDGLWSDFQKTLDRFGCD